MAWILKRGQMLVARGMQAACIIERELGEGGQAEVYRVRIGEQDYALKWYRPEYLAVRDLRMWERLRVAISVGSPSEQFLWPFDFVSLPHTAEYGGYVMPIKPAGFISLVDLMLSKCAPSFRTLTNVGFQLAHCFLKLHAAGLCYRDINFGNVFFDPESGDIRILDNDNVDVNLKPGTIKGTPGFMAPEVGRNEVAPNASTDRFSLAILLFHIFMIGHPLKGKREAELAYDPADYDGSQRLCAENPVFIFDPDDASNRPVPGIHDAILNFWPLYPESLRILFRRSFTIGLRDPESRVMENEWRKEMWSLRDSIFDCTKCDAENFFDIEKAKRKLSLDACWSCGAQLEYPPRMRVGGAHGFNLVVLSKGAQLYPHHLDADMYNFSVVKAEVLANPLRLKNLSRDKWVVKTMDGEASGSTIEVAPGESAALTDGAKIYFGRTEAEVKF